MAEFSSLPAMSIDPVAAGQRSALGMYELQQQQQNLERERSQLERDRTMLPLDVEAKKAQNKEAQQRSALGDIEVQNADLAKVAADTQAADPEDASQIWDTGMRDAAAQGNKSAGQFVGHYRPDLAERVSDLYGAYGPKGRGRGDGSGESAAGVTADQQALERAVGAMPVAQLDQALTQVNNAIAGFNKITDQQSWNAEIQAMRDAGIPVEKFLPSLEWSPLNYATASRAIKGIIPYRDAMQKRSSILAAGAIPPAAAPQGTSQYIGVTPEGKAVYHNPVTGQETTGETVVGPKPTAALSVFQYKMKLAGDAGYSSEDAMQFANGRKALPPERLRAMAQADAIREYGNISYANQDTIKNPEEWIRLKTQENFNLLSQGSGPVPGGGQAPRAAARNVVAAPAAQPPKDAVDAVRKAAGRPITFKNKQVWQWRDGKAVRVQ